MHPPFTIAYMTSRREPHWEWFLDSLYSQCEAEQARVIVVDFHCRDRSQFFSGNERILYHVPPKPTVWQGLNRKTKADYFAAANARNTAIALCPTDWIAFVDDLSVLLPGWADRVQMAMRENYIALGAYKKVKNLVVDGGHITSFEEFGPGVDSRLRSATDDHTSCSGSWLFGCSFAAPLEALLEVNGFDEQCDSTGLGSEDYCLGIRIGNLNRYSFRYDRKMMTYESEELHHNGSVLLRMDKGQSPNDKSHAMLRKATQDTRAPNNFDLRQLRADVAGRGFKAFPAADQPTEDWYDGQPVTEL